MLSSGISDTSQTISPTCDQSDLFCKSPKVKASGLGNQLYPYARETNPVVLLTSSS
ncbi:hypothetical protein JMJ77_0015060, partial [Colletotrichum scovillei]